MKISNTGNVFSNENGSGQHQLNAPIDHPTRYCEALQALANQRPPALLTRSTIALIARIWGARRVA